MMATMTLDGRDTAATSGLPGRLRLGLAAWVAWLDHLRGRWARSRDGGEAGRRRSPGTWPRSSRSGA